MHRIIAIFAGSGATAEFSHQLPNSDVGDSISKELLTRFECFDGSSG